MYSYYVFKCVRVYVCLFVCLFVCLIVCLFDVVCVAFSIGVKPDKKTMDNVLPTNVHTRNVFAK